MEFKLLPRIPLDALQEIFEKLSIETLKTLPAGKLPNNIPQDLLRKLDAKKRTVIDDLIFDASAHHLEEKLEIERLCQEVQPVIGDLLESKIEELEDLAELWSQDHGLTKRLEIATEEIEKEIKKVTKEFIHAENNIFRLSDGLYVADDQEKIKTALQNMETQNSGLAKWLKKYYRIRLALVKYELDQTRAEVNKKNVRFNEILNEISEITHRIESSTAAMGLTQATARNNHYIKELYSEKEQLEDMKHDYDIIVPEARLIEWMNIIVDIYLCPLEGKDIETSLQSAQKSLSNFLVEYCEIQSLAARQIADQEFSTLDKEQGIRYMLESTRFITEYFRDKEAEMTDAEEGFTQNMRGHLEAYKQEILAEIEANTSALSEPN